MKRTVQKYKKAKSTLLYFTLCSLHTSTRMYILVIAKSVQKFSSYDAEIRKKTTRVYMYMYKYIKVMSP